VTIFISTHFMNEAARCDRISLMHSGRILASAPPAELVEMRGVQTLEQAFISYLEEAAGPAPPPSTSSLASSSAHQLKSPINLSISRMFAYAYCEMLGILRDPVRLAVSFLGTIFLMLVFGYGITMDVEHLSFAVLDQDQSPESRAYLEEFADTRYFELAPPLANNAELESGLKSGRLAFALEIPPDFGRTLKRGKAAEISAWVDGAMPFRSETVLGYLSGIHQTYLSHLELRQTGKAQWSPVTIEIRNRYNQDLKSLFSMVPSVIGLLLVFIPAILMALGVVREKELGSIINLYVTPISRTEFLLGKQLPYIAVAMSNYLCMLGLAVFLFGVPVKGSLIALTLGALLYTTATTGLGLLISAFTSTQIAALFGTAMLTIIPSTQFSGMVVPVSSLTGTAAVIGYGFPATYFMKISVGAFTKGLGFVDLWGNLLALAAFIPVLTSLSVLLLPKQER
jgi:ribosome-dependent ATPase